MVASVGADAEGRSYNVNADEAAGAVAAALGAYKVIFLTDVEGWLADPATRRASCRETDVAQIRRAIERERRRRRHAAEAAGMRGRGRGGRAVRAHRRRPRSRTRCCSSCSRMRASGRRWTGDESAVGSPHVGRSRAIELERTHMMQTYKRLPVEFVLGRGLAAVRRGGREYLDFLAGISVCNAGHCHPHVVEAIREQAGRLIQVSNLYYNEPARAAGRAPGDKLRAGRAGVPVQLRHGGQRGGDQACPQAPPRRGDRRAGGRLPRSHDGVAVGDAAAGQAGAVRAARARLPGRSA